MTILLIPHAPLLCTNLSTILQGADAGRSKLCIPRDVDRLWLCRKGLAAICLYEVGLWFTPEVIPKGRSGCSLRDELANDRVDITVGPEAKLQRTADVEVARPGAYDRHHALVRFAADTCTC